MDINTKASSKAAVMTVLKCRRRLSEERSGGRGFLNSQISVGHVTTFQGKVVGKWRRPLDLETPIALSSHGVIAPPPTGLRFSSKSPANLF